MGTELNIALKFLVAPYTPEIRAYAEICMSLIGHSDSAKNKFAESVKFRRITQ